MLFLVSAGPPWRLQPPGPWPRLTPLLPSHLFSSFTTELGISWASCFSSDIAITQAGHVYHRCCPLMFINPTMSDWWAITSLSTWIWCSGGGYVWIYMYIAAKQPWIITPTSEVFLLKCCLVFTTWCSVLRPINSLIFNMLNEACAFLFIKKKKKKKFSQHFSLTSGEITCNVHFWEDWQLSLNSFSLSIILIAEHRFPNSSDWCAATAASLRPLLMSCPLALCAHTPECSIKGWWLETGSSRCFTLDSEGFVSLSCWGRKKSQ